MNKTCDLNSANSRYNKIIIIPWFQKNSGKRMTMCTKGLKYKTINVSQNSVYKAEHKFLKS